MKAMVLCAGFGTRLGNLTREIPKPMLEIQGRPILEYILANLKRFGFGQVAINLHFRPELIQNYFGDGTRFGLQLTYSYEPELLGTAGAVKKIESFFGNDPFLVHYGDVVTNQDLGAMLRSHEDKNALATLLLHQRAKSNSVVSLDGKNRIIGFLERPNEQQRAGIQSPWVNSGVCICSPQLLDFIPPNVCCDLPRDIFSKLLDRPLFGYPLSAFRTAVDSPERLQQLRDAVSQRPQDFPRF